MWLYLIIFFIPVIAYLYKKKSVYGNKGLEHSVWFLALFMLALCIFVGISDMLGGYDRYIYGQIFDSTAETIEDGGRIIESAPFQLYTKEIGYDFFNVLVAFCTSNRYIFIFVITVFIYILAFISFKRYMTNYPFAIILFLGLLFFFTFTYLRQILAVGISWLAIKYIIDRKFYKFCGIIILAFLFHNSAIILFPFYFFPIKKFKIEKVIVIMLVCLVMGATGLSNGLFEIFGGLTNAEDRTTGYALDTSGFRFAYMIEAFFFLSYIFYGYKRIPDDKIKIILLNMSLAFCGILLFFIKSENGGRLSWFFMIGLISTLTYIYSENRSNILGRYSIILICICLYLRILIGWGVLLTPYKTFFTNGYRKDDFIYNSFEYDHNYDRNKLYK